MNKATILKVGIMLLACSVFAFAAEPQAAPTAPPATQHTQQEQASHDRPDATLPTASAEPDSATAIRTVLDTQVAAWNRGDLEGYMAGYWNSPELTFYSGGTITKGWQPTLDRYRQRYQSGGREMGRLDFSSISIELLGPESAVARGRWHLAMKNGQQPKGLFTVIFRRFPEGWRIIHDHSSAE